MKTLMQFCWNGPQRKDLNIEGRKEAEKYTYWYRFLTSIAFEHIDSIGKSNYGRWKHCNGLLQIFFKIAEDEVVVRSLLTNESI